MTLTLPMRRRRLAPMLAAVMLVLAGAPAALADDPTPDTVVATINGEPITEGDLAAAAANYTDELSRLPAEQRKAQLLQAIIDIKLFANAAAAAGMDKNPRVVRSVSFLTARELRNEYLREKILGSVDDAAIKKRFDEEVAKFVPGDEVHVSHILVKTEDEAKAIIADLDKGGDFAAIAKEKSQDPGSAGEGGDLGFIAKGQTVQPFEDAAFATPVGTYSKTPVQSQFGWHILKVIETRKEPAPQLDNEKDTIRQALLSEAFAKAQNDLHAAAQIKILDPAAEMPAPDAPTPPAGADAPAKPAQ
jgi:peptidyl-prolyl cis-trans isomerase C